jgi:deoxyribodipyrimidine photo-lyase
VRECERVLPAFVFDDVLLAAGGPNRIAFLLESLRDLDGALRERGARLVVRRGDPVTEALRLAYAARAQAIYLSSDASAYARRREQRLAAACASERIALRLCAGSTVVAPGELLPSGGGDHYRVFTPYWRAWQAVPRRRALPAPRHVRTPRAVPAGRLPALARLTQGACSPERMPGGETAGRARLERWLRDGLADYERLHDDLAADATSRMSPYLHFGCLSANALLSGVAGRPGAEAFARQLCWRDFYHQVLAATPDFPHADYRAHVGRWSTSKRLAQAWRAGRTGYPIVDAGMRQLAREGYMHNRARLIVSSFLTKLLRIDWRIGAAHFAQLLLDADLANNVGNWQWVAGTGNDTRPGRVLMPLRQAQRFDRDGDYVRRHVPELEALAGRAVHEPWRLPAAARRALGYPRPVIDAAAAAAEFRRSARTRSRSQDVSSAAGAGRAIR